MTMKQKLGCALFYGVGVLATALWLGLMGVVCSRLFKVLL